MHVFKHLLQKEVSLKLLKQMLTIAKKNEEVKQN